MNLDVDIKRKATVRVSRKDLRKLLTENEQMGEQITALQTRLNELLEENRKLRAEKLQPKPAIDPEDDDIEPFPDFNPQPHLIDPNIYFDGSNGLRNGPRFK